MRLLRSICLLFLLSGFITSRAQRQPTILAPPLIDTKAVLQQVFSHVSLSQYLVHYNSDNLVFRYEVPPLYNGKAIPKPTFNIIFSDRRFVCRAAYKPQKHDPAGKVLSTVLIGVTRVNIDYDSAQVNLKIPSEGVVGLFRLARASKDGWRVVKYSTYEI